MQRLLKGFTTIGLQEVVCLQQLQRPNAVAKCQRCRTKRFDTSGGSKNAELKQNKKELAEAGRKVCYGCKQAKAVKGFPSKNDRKCRQCLMAYFKLYHQTHRAKALERAKKFQQDTRMCTFVPSNHCISGGRHVQRAP